ncbi:Golgi to ER traffic- protein [Puccinia graminis f. sp. tritici]|uniref:Golgi to ER traffic-protein n=1 Tax=Puccinia graminis f. sp. tritici TaxID=56615 RepID=A0A5B0S3W9_PUCGR|nr:Golgi to ER traffic- protein [Puccinia graminis f. sp. tritici]
MKVFLTAQVPYGSSPPRSPALNVPISSPTTSIPAHLPSLNQGLPPPVSTPNIPNLRSAQASRALLPRTISGGTAGANSLGLPNLTTVTLAEMKAMRTIWYRTRDSLRSGLEDLVTLGLISKSPQLSNKQHQNLALVTAFCSRLDRIIEVSEVDGISDATVELIDITGVDEDETSSSIPIGSGPAGNKKADIGTHPISPMVGNQLLQSNQNSLVHDSHFGDHELNINNPELDHSSYTSAAQDSRLTTSNTVPREVVQPTTNRPEEPKCKDKSRKQTPRPKVTPIPSAKRTRKGFKDMSQEEQKAHQQRAELRKKEREASTYIQVPQIGNFMQQVWSPSRCEDMQELHEKMKTASRNPKWDLGPQLMNLVHDMVEWFTPDTHSSCIIQLLLQVDAVDPFFQHNVVQLDLIEKAYKSKDPIKATSWKTLYSMMIRTGHEPGYTKDKLLGTAISKLYTLSVSSLEHLHHYLKPASLAPGNHSNKSQDSLHLAGHFIIGKIRALKADMMASGDTGSEKKSNGLMILQKRIWDTLLCCLMMQQSKFGSDPKDPGGSNGGSDGSIEESLRKSGGRNLFKDGDVENTKSQEDMKEWGKLRLAAFGSMAIFFLYGTAGWWHCLTDSHNFNQKDVWALVQLAHAKNEWLYPKGHNKERPAEDTPWYTTDSFVRWLLIQGGMHIRDADKVDWEYAPRFWAKQVTEINISRFALQDILSEVCRRDTKSLNYKGQVSPSVKFDKGTQAIVTKLQQQIRTELKNTLDSHHASIRAHEEALEDDMQSHASHADPQDETSSVDIPLVKLPKRPAPSTDLNPGGQQTSKRSRNHDTTNFSSSPLSSPLPL